MSTDPEDECIQDLEIIWDAQPGKGRDLSHCLVPVRVDRRRRIKSAQVFQCRSAYTARQVSMERQRIFSSDSTGQISAMGFRVMPYTIAEAGGPRVELARNWLGEGGGQLAAGKSAWEDRPINAAAEATSA